MKIFFSIFYLILSFNLCLAQSNLSQLEFLIGTWQVEGKQNFESWKKENDTVFIGLGYKIKDSISTVTETLKLQVVKDNIVYTATVPNQNDGEAVPFTLNTSRHDLFSFENPDHDFPKKIQYQLTSEGKIMVNVLGENDKGFSFYFIKPKY